MKSYSTVLIRSFVVLLVVCVICGRVEAQSGAGKSALNPDVTIAFDHTSAYKALISIFKKYNIKYEISPNAIKLLSAEYKTAEFHEVALEVVLYYLIHSRECEYKVKKGGYYIDWRDPENISFECKDLLPVDALQKLFDGIWFSYLFAEECLPTKKITVPPIIAHFEVVLEKLLDSMKPAQLKVAHYDKLFVIYSPRFKYKYLVNEDPPNPNIHCDLHNVPAPLALKAIFTSWQVSYVLPTDIGGEVSIEGTREPFRVTLDHILRQVRNIKTREYEYTYKVEDRVFYVMIKHYGPL